jgi:hypothetical protein
MRAKTTSVVLRSEKHQKRRTTGAPRTALPCSYPAHLGRRAGSMHFHYEICVISRFFTEAIVRYDE